MGLGPWEIFWIFLAILLIFGGKKIPEIARALGKGMSEFNKAKKDITESLNEEMDKKENDEPKKQDSDSKTIDTDDKSVDDNEKSEKS